MHMAELWLDQIGTLAVNSGTILVVCIKFANHIHNRPQSSSCSPYWL